MEEESYRECVRVREGKWEKRALWQWSNEQISVNQESLRPLKTRTQQDAVEFNVTNNKIQKKRATEWKKWVSRRRGADSLICHVSIFSVAYMEQEGEFITEGFLAWWITHTLASGPSAGKTEQSKRKGKCKDGDRKTTVCQRQWESELARALAESCGFFHSICKVVCFIPIELCSSHQLCFPLKHTVSSNLQRKKKIEKPWPTRICPSNPCSYKMCNSCH